MAWYRLTRLVFFYVGLVSVDEVSILLVGQVSVDVVLVGRVLVDVVSILLVGRVLVDVVFRDSRRFQLKTA